MHNPWEIYDRLIAPIDADITVDEVGETERVVEVTSSEGNVGRALRMPTDSRPPLFSGNMRGASLRTIAELAKSWNFAEAAYGMAAINAWWGAKERALSNGFTEMEEPTFQSLFDPYAEAVRGKRVGIIGHFPFARAALPDAGEILILERTLRPGDYPDSACEYVLPECDYVFITGSSFVNKTLPRLLELCANPYTVVVGPSTPCAPLILEYGADTVLGFTSVPAPDPEAARMGDGTWYGTRLKLEK